MTSPPPAAPLASAADRGPAPYRAAARDRAVAEASILTVLDGPADALRPTAEALRGQSFQAFEWVVIADGARALQDLALDDPRIRVIERAGLDPAGARNLGRSAARSSRLWEVTPGERPAPTAVEQALWALESGVSPGAANGSVPFETPPVARPFRNRLEKPEGVRRVLVILPCLEVSGVEAFTADLIAELQQRRHQVSVCATLSAEGRWLPRFTELTPDVFGLPGFLRPPDVPRFLLYLIESRGIDVVLTTNSYLAYQFLPFLRSRSPGVAFVDYVHMEAEHWRHGGMGRLSAAHHEVLDLTVVSTEHLRQWMVERGARAEHIEVCHTNVDPAVWNPARFCRADIRRALGVTDGEALLLYAARIVPQKRPQLLGEIVRRLAETEGPAFVCVVAGEGPELPALRRFASEHGLEGRMRFEGMVTRERVQALQAAADVFVLPSLFEGLSVTLFEAMASQTVPVAADVGGHRELVTPDCGMLIRRGDDELDRYVEALRRLLREPAVRRRMAANARARVIARFSLSAMGDRMAALLDRACERARTSPRASVGPGLALEYAMLAVEYGRLEYEHLVTARAAAETATLRAPADLSPWSAEEIARVLGLRRILQALAFRLAGTPRLTWLRVFRSLGKRLLGG